MSLLKYAINGIIAPHGITDIIHARQNNLLPQLFMINSISVLSSVLLDELYLDTTLDGIFILSSVIHFGRDFPENKFISRYLLSSFLLIISILYNHDILLFYMLFIHVPNHYVLNWKYLENTTLESISVLYISTTLFLMMETVYSFSTLTPSIKGIIISHIVYEEKYIFN
jgi:hypothetical protein